MRWLLGFGLLLVVLAGCGASDAVDIGGADSTNSIVSGSTELPVVGDIDCAEGTQDLTYELAREAVGTETIDDAVDQFWGEEATYGPHDRAALAKFIDINTVRYVDAAGITQVELSFVNFGNGYLLESARSCYEVDRSSEASPPYTEGPVDSAAESPATWEEFTAWDPATTLTVDDFEVAQLTPRYECFDDLCGSPMDYWLTQDFLVPVGGRIGIEADPTTELQLTALKLSPELSFEFVPPLEDGVGSVSVGLDSPGFYHVDVRADIVFGEIGGTNRLRHFMWIQVVDGAAPCLTSPATATTVTGVIDEHGCPFEAASLSLTTLHPAFHCAPWPATLARSTDPERSYWRSNLATGAGVEVIESPPEDLLAMGAFIPSGELFSAESDADAFFVERSDGVFERWSVDPSGFGCD